MSINNNSSHVSPASNGSRIGEQIILANWIDRFLAWIVDVIIVSIGLSIIFFLISIPFLFIYNEIEIQRIHNSIQPIHYIVSSLIFFGYWTYFESTSGQSIGKRLLRIKTTDIFGKSINKKSAATQAFGKAFLLPFDIFLGWIFTNNKRQRIFNKISSTIVIKLSKESLLILNI